jgi:adenosylhomocysteine nucleosidase
LQYPIVRLVVALPAEAKPIVAHYRLKRCMDEHAFPVYRRDAIALLVSGVGKAAAAAAVAYGHAVFGRRTDAVWLNAGIAGHSAHPVGASFVAHKIVDGDTGKSWYPVLCFPAPCPSLPLHTVSRPEHGYGEDALYDMEASAFFETAARFGTGELIHCLKTVSDNRRETVHEIDAGKAARCVERSLEPLDVLLERLRALHSELPAPESADIGDFAARWHFTEQQRLHLVRLLRRWRVLAGAEFRLDQLAVDPGNARAVLLELEAHIDRLPVRLEGSQR